jgi:PTS system mannitol-specific IIC component
MTRGKEGKERMSTPDIQDKKNRTGRGASAQVQRFGRFLSGMIMPNIGAFVAWGLITALFIESGWIPVDKLGGFGEFGEPGLTGGGLVGPMITYLLPILIGYTGGRMVHGQRGAVIGAIVTAGVIVGASVPMFLGAMLVGPGAAWVLKQFDKLIHGKVKSGFEMLVDNFSIGIIGAGLAVLGRLIIGPVVSWLVDRAGDGVDVLVSNNQLPHVSIIVEPAKVLFLNNAINHGVFTPLGSQDVIDHGKSILFMIESNPGPGLGMLLAFMLVGPKMYRASIPGVAIIHFLGGIHEVYFPYVLMKPKLIIAMILGGMSGVLTGTILNNGLTGPPSPGSIFAYFAVSPPSGVVGMIIQVLIAAAVAFAAAWFLLVTDKTVKIENEEFEAQQAAEAEAAAAA